MTILVFFIASRGLRQGCSLSPLLFFLLIEGLNSMIYAAKAVGDISSIKVSKHIYISHLLFMDDVLILGDGIMEEWGTFCNIFDTLCLTSDMSISENKSSFLHHNVPVDIWLTINTFLPFVVAPLEYGFTYLDYHLKPNYY